MMDKVQREVSDTLHQAELCKWVFYLVLLLLIGWFIAGPFLDALDRNDYQRPRVVSI